MTDARLPSRWLYAPEFDGLSDRAWRTMASALMWSNEQGTDGGLPITSLRFLHPMGVDDATTQELVDAGKWEKTGNGFQVLNWQKSQSLAADVDKQRERNRRNVKAFRQRESGSPSEPDGYVIDEATGEVIAYESGDISGDVHGVPVGQDRTGKDASKGSELKLAGTSKSYIKMAVAPADSSMRPCTECQRRRGMPTPWTPCPQHQSETA